MKHALKMLGGCVLPFRADDTDDKLMKCLRMRVVDGAVLKLIKQWLDENCSEVNALLDEHISTSNM